MTNKQQEQRIWVVICIVFFAVAMVAMFTSENAVDRNIGDNDGTTVAY